MGAAVEDEGGGVVEVLGVNPESQPVSTTMRQRRSALRASPENFTPALASIKSSAQALAGSTPSSFFGSTINTLRPSSTRRALRSSADVLTTKLTAAAATHNAAA